MTINGKVHVVAWHDHDEYVSHIIFVCRSYELAAQMAKQHYEMLSGTLVVSLAFKKDDTAATINDVWHYVDTDLGLSLTITGTELYVG